MWVHALSAFLEGHRVTAGYHTMVIEYGSVRPKGERLKRFGGTASGHESLQRMFEEMADVLARCEGRLRPVDALDLCNIIGENVVVGGKPLASHVNQHASNSGKLLRQNNPEPRLSPA